MEPEPLPLPKVAPEPVRVAAVPAAEPKKKPPEPVVRRVEPPRPPSVEEPEANESPRWVARFPDLRVQAVRWHPDSARREVQLLVDATRVVAAREGDIIIGVAVHRIDPGAVELRVGETSRLLRVGQ